MNENSQDVSVKDVLARMKAVYHVTRDAELARALDMSPQTLSSWRQRDAIPYALCVECARSKKVSLDWLLYGDSNQVQTLAKTQDSDPTIHHSLSDQDLRQELDRVLQTLPREDVADLLSEARNRQKLRMLEKKFETLQSEFFASQGAS